MFEPHMRDGRPTTWSSWSSLGFEFGGWKRFRDAGRLKNWSKFVCPLSSTLVLNTFDIPTAMIAFPTKDISGEGDTTGS